MEGVVARDSGAAIAAKRAGIVDQIDGSRIVVRVTDDTARADSVVDIYRLKKFQRSNQTTCYNQVPLIHDGERVEAGTVLADDPTLTARLPDGTLAARQPLRVVVGEREISSESNILNDDSRTMVIRTHDPHEVLRALSDRTDVILEGGPTLAGAFVRAGLVDRILAYLAPTLLGGPITVIDDAGVSTISQASRWRFDGVETVGADVRLSVVPN